MPAAMALLGISTETSWCAVLCCEGRTFKRKPPAGGAERTFVSFILEPLYKIYSQVRESFTHTHDLTRLVWSFAEVVLRASHIATGSTLTCSTKVGLGILCRLSHAASK